METVVVPVKPWYESKINWAQILGVMASFATLFGFVVPPDLIAQTVAGLAALQGVMTFVFKTWFTTSVTPSSAAKV